VERPLSEVVVGFFQRELAALATLREAMNQSLATGGVHGRLFHLADLLGASKRTASRYTAHDGTDLVDARDRRLAPEDTGKTRPTPKRDVGP
jgi:hypothetical protein